MENVLPLTGVMVWPIIVLLILGIVILIISLCSFLGLKHKEKKSKKSTVYGRRVSVAFFIFAVLMLITSGILEIYNLNENRSINKDNEKTVSILQDVIDNDSILNEELDEEDATKRDAVNVNDMYYIGMLFFPDLDGLYLPVIKNCTDDNLKISVCKYSGDILDDNLVIAGHRYRSSFAKLSKLDIGSEVQFLDLNGMIYKYKLKDIEIIEPDEVDRMQNGDWDLTLFTCTYNNAKRVAYRFEYCN